MIDKISDCGIEDGGEHVGGFGFHFSKIVARNFRPKADLHSRVLQRLTPAQIRRSIAIDGDMARDTGFTAMLNKVPPLRDGRGAPPV